MTEKKKKKMMTEKKKKMMMNNKMKNNKMMMITSRPYSFNVTGIPIQNNEMIALWFKPEIIIVFEVLTHLERSFTKAIINGPKGVHSFTTKDDRSS